MTYRYCIKWKPGDLVEITKDFTRYFGQRLAIILDTHCDAYGEKDLELGRYYKAYVQNEMCEGMFREYELKEPE